MFFILIIVEYIFYAMIYSIPALIITFLSSRCFEFVQFDRNTFIFTLVLFLVIRFISDFKITWKFNNDE